MTLTLLLFKEIPLPGVLQKTDPTQLLCRSPPREQRRCASTGRSRARPILRQVQRLPLFCAATEGGVAGIILNMRICAIFRSRAAFAAEPAVDVSPPASSSSAGHAAFTTSARAHHATPPTSVSGHGSAPGQIRRPRSTASAFPELPQFQNSVTGKKSQQPKPWQQAPAGRLRAKKKPRTGQGDITGND